MGTELKVTLLFLKRFELAHFEAVTKIVWKEPYRKEDSKENQYWEGYQFALRMD